jgi:hypothetical protein
MHLIRVEFLAEMNLGLTPAKNLLIKQSQQSKFLDVNL